MRRGAGQREEWKSPPHSPQAPRLARRAVAEARRKAARAVEALIVVAVDLGPAATLLGEFELAPADEGVGEKGL